MVCDSVYRKEKPTKYYKGHLSVGFLFLFEYLYDRIKTSTKSFNRFGLLLPKLNLYNSVFDVRVKTIHQINIHTKHPTKITPAFEQNTLSLVWVSISFFIHGSPWFPVCFPEEGCFWRGWLCVITDLKMESSKQIS